MRVIFLLITLSGCGMPELDRHPIESGLVPPEWPVVEGLYLHDDGDGQLDLKGSILIWDEKVSVADIKYLSEVSNHKKAQTVHYEQTFKRVRDERRQLAESQPLIDAKTAELQTLRNEAYQRARQVNPDEWQRQRQRLWQLGSEWLQTKLDALAKLDENWDRTATEQVLRRYCEGKLFAMAVNPQILRRKFTNRPTPHIMCESYYRQLFTSEICQPEPAGKDYLQCIWLDGILVSDYFRATYQEVERQADKIVALRTMISEQPQQFKELILAIYDDPRKSRYLKFYQRIGQIGFGDRSITVRPPKGQPFILQTVHDVESPAQLEDLELLAAGNRLFASGASTDEISERQLLLVKALQMMARTVAGTSVSDYKFNRGLAMPDFDRINLDLCHDSDSILSPLAEFACNLHDAKQLLPELQEVVGSLLAEDQLLITTVSSALKRLQDNYQQTVDRLETEDSEAFASYSQALDKAVNAARSDNLAQALFAQAELRIARRADMYAVTFKLLEAGDTHYVACFTVTGETVSCPFVKEGEKEQLLQASYHAEQGKLTLELSSLEQLGFAYLSRDSDNRTTDRASFCDIDQFTDLSLQMELYANKYADSLEIISGKGLFKNNSGTTVYQASVGFERRVEL